MASRKCLQIAASALRQLTIFLKLQKSMFGTGLDAVRKISQEKTLQKRGIRSVDHVSHIKNPLTVIAIFAGLAEASGTAILPFLSQPTQAVYVWFLMIFPCLLVCLFFFTLLSRHHVLYAPSDYRDEKIFENLFVRAPDRVGVEKLAEEVAEEVEGQTTARLPEAITHQVQSNVEQENVEVPAQSDIDDRSALIQSDIREKAQAAETLVIAKLSESLGLDFQQGVTPRSQPGVRFDAVSVSPNGTLVVEVRYTRLGFLSSPNLHRTFLRVDKFAATLPDEVRSRFRFIFAVATEGEANNRIKSIRSSVRRVAQAYSFETDIKIFKMENLQEDF